MANNVKLDVLWSPTHDDKFYSWGGDVITLYHILPLKDIVEKPSFVVSEEEGAVAGWWCGVAGLRRVAASPSAHVPLLAAGLAAGGVRLLQPHHPAHPAHPADHHASADSPLHPLHNTLLSVGGASGRACSDVCWGESGGVACALERARGEPGLLLWELGGGGASVGGATEMCLSEGVAGVAWAGPRLLLVALAAGTGAPGPAGPAPGTAPAPPPPPSLSGALNIVKLFDLSESHSKSALSLGGWAGAGRGVLGVAGAGGAACAWGAGGGALWDVRRAARPLATLAPHAALARVALCPAPLSALALFAPSAAGTAAAPRLYRLHALPAGGGAPDADTAADADESREQCEGVMWERAMRAWGAGAGAGAVEEEATGASWGRSGRLLLATCGAGGARVAECGGGAGGGGGAACWGRAGTLAYAHARRLHLAAPAPAPAATAAPHADIEHVMRRRAQLHYGHNSELWQNGEVVMAAAGAGAGAEERELRALWHWLAHARHLHAHHGWGRGGAGAGAAGGGGHVPGACELLAGHYRSEPTTPIVADFPHLNYTVYKSAERSRVLQLCGWGEAGGGAGGELAALWAGAGAGAGGTSVGREAALAVWGGRARLGLEALGRAPSSAPSGAASSAEAGLVALALAGAGGGALWHELAPVARAHLACPYLRALLAFLAPSGAGSAGGAGGVEAALQERGLAITDRVALAATYLGDAALAAWAGAEGARLAGEGALAAAVLGGLGGVGGVGGVGGQLLQRYVDRTGDVQTAALLAATPHLAPPHPQHTLYIQSYRELLERWRLWSARAELDALLPAHAHAHLQHQVCISCGWCGKAVGGRGSARGGGAAGGVRAQTLASHAPPHAPHAPHTPHTPHTPALHAKLKISACPQCRKPLPRCSICLVHLGTWSAAGAGGGGGALGGCGGGGGTGAHIAGWFTWCVTCRHAGHAHHLMEWFQEHAECPVSSCTCRCLALDPAAAAPAPAHTAT